MKKIHIKVLILLLAPICVNAQSTIENLEKYWKYRERLITYFLQIGPAPGESIPIGIRNAYNGNDSYEIEVGDATIYLGKYFGMLATEYRLLKDSNLDVSQTVKELSYALDAFDRLDRCESKSPWNKDADALDGFFMREDFPPDFICSHPTLNKGLFDSDTRLPDPATVIPGSGKPIGVVTIDAISTALVEDQKKGAMSQDQVYHLLMGLNLIKEFVDYGDLNVVDAERNRNFYENINQRAQNIAHRIINYIQRNLWLIRDPNNDLVLRGADAYIFSHPTAIIGFNITGSVFIDPIVIENQPVWQAMKFGLLQPHEINLYMGLTLAALSNSWTTGLINVTQTSILANADPENLGSFYTLLRQVLHGGIFLFDRETIETQLNSAPCDGPFYHSVGDQAPMGWASSDRWAHEKEEQDNGNSGFPGNYNGLDYMLLHNLYHIHYKNDLPSFGEMMQTVITQNFPVPPFFMPGSGSVAGPALFLSSIKIVSTSKISAVDHTNFLHAENGFVVFVARKEIDLLPGFEVELGANFTGLIEPTDCPSDFFATANTPLLPPDCPTIEPMQLNKRDNTGNHPMLLNNKIIADNEVVLNPNPIYGKEGTLLYAVMETGPVKISIVDLFGKTIFTLIDNSNHEAGEYKIDFELLNFPSGIYYYKMEAASFSTAKKMVVVK